MDPTNDVPSYLIDGLQALAMHNGVARIMFMKMNMAGQPVPEVQLMIPLDQMKEIIEGLQKATKKR